MQVLAVAVPEGGPKPSTQLKAFRKKHALTYPLTADNTGELASRFGVNFIPANMILSRDGRLIAKPESVEEIVTALNKVSK